MSESKIIQIIPAIGVRSVYKVGDTEIRGVVNAIALDEDGYVHFLESDNIGIFDDPSEMSNFDRYEFDGDEGVK